MKNSASFQTISLLVTFIFVVSCNGKSSDAEKGTIRAKNVAVILRSVLDYKEQKSSPCIFSDTLFYTSEKMLPQKFVNKDNDTVRVLSYNELPNQPIHSIIDTCIINDSTAVMVIVRRSCGSLMKSELTLQQGKWSVVSIKESDI